MTDTRTTYELVNPDQTTRKDSLTMGNLLTGLGLGIALFALVYHFGALDSVISTWTPTSHQSAHTELHWN